MPGPPSWTTIKSKYSTDEKLTSRKDITSYNNFYEFGTKKSDPAKYAHEMTTDPWSVKIDGLVGKPGTYPLDDILKNVTLGRAHLPPALR